LEVLLMADLVPVTEESLRAAMRDPRYWRSGHPEREAYGRWVTEGWRAFVNEGQGKNGVVQVRAYTRTRNGKTEQVGAHTRADPPGGAAKDGSQSTGGKGGFALPIHDSAGSTAPSPRPGITAASPTLVIFVGGGGDAKSGIVSGFEDSLAVRTELGHRGTAYFANDEQAAIIARINAEPQETRIVLVGHSWGGDTAAQAAAALGQQGRPVDTLVTVDPVGRGLSDDYLRRVRAGSREWVNIHARAAVRDRSDAIADAGGRYGDWPRAHATRHIEAPLNHGDFDGLLRSNDPASVSGFRRILGR
jgi:pimeloyl-ACP methyl ester carboxylesterase